LAHKQKANIIHAISLVKLNEKQLATGCLQIQPDKFPADLQTYEYKSSSKYSNVHQA